MKNYKKLILGLTLFSNIYSLHDGHYGHTDIKYSDLFSHAKKEILSLVSSGYPSGGNMGFYDNPVTNTYIETGASDNYYTFKDDLRTLARLPLEDIANGINNIRYLTAIDSVYSMYNYPSMSAGYRLMQHPTIIILLIYSYYKMSQKNDDNDSQNIDQKLYEDSERILLSSHPIGLAYYYYKKFGKNNENNNQKLDEKEKLNIDINETSPAND